MRWNRFKFSMSWIGATALFSVAVQLVVSSAFLFSQAASQSTTQSVGQTNNAAATQRPFLIMIDAAHGGSEPGAVLNPTLTEKDVTLSIARRLRQELASRGIPSPLVRDADATVTTDQRAAAVNSAHPALYISIHATSQGKGMRIYSALLPAENDGDRGPFLDWQTAQSAALARSRWMQSQIFASIQKTGFPARTLTAPLRPLTSITVPALAIEIAPTTGDVAQLASADFQQMISAALSNSIALLRYKLETEPGP